MINKKILSTIFVMILLVFSVFLVGCGKEIKSEVIEGDVIKIGYIDALTGDAAEYGQVSQRAVKIAVDEINEKGGIGGKKLEIIYEDGRCIGKDAATAAQKLIEIDKVQAIISISCSGMVLAVAPIAEEKKVIAFSSYGSSPDITNAGDYVFRNSYSDADSGKAAAELISSKHKTVGVISELTDFCQAYKRVFVKEFEKMGGKVVADEVFDQETKDFRTQITKIMAKNPEAIFVDPQTAATGGPLLKQIKDLGYEGQVYANFFLSGAEGLETAGDAAEGVMFISDPEPADSDRKIVLFEKYEKLHNEKPAFDYPLASNYDAVYILKQTIEAVGYDATKIKDYLYTMDDFEGALGKYHFDENGDVVGVKPLKKIIRNGKAERLDD